MISNQRATNIGIMLSKFSAYKSYEHIGLAVLTLDKTLTEEKLEALLTMAPTPLELPKLETYIGPTKELTLGEQFCLAMTKFPRLVSKAGALLFQVCPINCTQQWLCMGICVNVHLRVFAHDWIRGHAHAAQRHSCTFVHPCTNMPTPLGSKDKLACSPGRASASRYSGEPTARVFPAPRQDFPTDSVNRKHDERN